MKNENQCESVYLFVTPLRRNYSNCLYVLLYKNFKLRIIMFTMCFFLHGLRYFHSRCMVSWYLKIYWIQNYMNSIYLNLQYIYMKPEFKTTLSIILRRDQAVNTQSSRKQRNDNDRLNQYVTLTYTPGKLRTKVNHTCKASY